MDIIVLAGGYSFEREVSLASGSLIANALLENGHRVLLLDLYLGLKDVTTFEEAYQKYQKSEYSFKVKKELPNLEQVKELKDKPNELIGENVLPICQSADAVFLALHGEIGENGKLQAVFDLYDIKYTGSDYFGSALAMNKVASKEMMRTHGILTPQWCLLEEEEHPQNITAPCVVKPNDSGSSIGVSIVEKEEDLPQTIKEAQKYSTSILLEEKITGREFSVGILGEKVLPPIEIIPKKGFYDYENKYQEGATIEICPAEITEEENQQLTALARKVHHVLRLGYYSRIDFIIDEKGKAYCIEANSLPGMTPTSLFPQEAFAIGLSYNELCEELIQSAVSDHTC
jgi:D-alanine-D-alanine ligase